MGCSRAALNALPYNICTRFTLIVSMNRKSIYIIFAAIVALCFGCIEDRISTSPSDQPDFSVDTLNFGVVYTGELTEVYSFVVYNRHNRGIIISDISMSGENASMFRLNVDGLTGDSFKDTEIRANDSIFVFVEAILPENGVSEPKEVNANVNFLTNGVSSSVLVSAFGQDINRLKGEIIDADRRLPADKPYRVIDSLVVAEGATLTIEEGVRLLCHDKTKIIVRGRLVSEGTVENPVYITGDRVGEVIPDVSFDIMSRQWDGIEIWPTSYDNCMQYTEVSNTSYGVSLFGYGDDLERAKLRLINCKLRNSGEYVLVAYNASIEAVGCEFAEAAYGLVYMVGGWHRFDQCTAANNYLFAAVQGSAWTFIDPANVEGCEDFAVTQALVTNSITHGYGGDVTPGDLTGYDIYFNRCSFKSAGTDDDNFINSLWECDPLFYTEREKYYFDYRLKPDSPAITAADPELRLPLVDCDFYGVKRSNEIGAYSYVAPPEESK